MSDLATLFFANATIVMVILAWYAWHVNRLAHANRSLMAFCLLLAVGNAGQIFFQLAYTREIALACYHFSWIGWSLYPPFAVLMAVHLTGKAHLLCGRLGVVLLFLPAVIFLVRSQVGLLGISGVEPTIGGGFALVRTYLPWDVAYSVYQYSYDLLALGIIGWWSARSSSKRKRLQAVVIIGCSCLALAIDFVQYAQGSHGGFALLWGLEQLVFSAGLTFALTHLQFTVPTARLAANYILEHIRDLVLFTDVKGIILQVNSPGCTLLGYDAGVLIQRPVGEFIQDGWDGACQMGALQNCEVYFRTQDGGMLPMLLISSPLRDAYGDVVGTVLVGKDLRQTRQLQQEITERTRVEEALREADQAKDRFLATLSHELLTPLAIIFPWLELARSNAVYVPKALEYIEANAHRQHRIVKDLLDISSIIHEKMALRPEYIELTDLARHSVGEYQQIAASQQVTLTFVPPTEALPINADPTRIRQVIANLLSNALKSVKSGGQITVVALRSDQSAVLRIQDDGCGIPARELARIFTPFTQGSNAAGTLGLGLAVVKGIIELHQGRVFAESPGVDGGSTFTIELPLCLSPIPSALPVEDGEGETVLTGFIR